MGARRFAWFLLVAACSSNSTPAEEPTILPGREDAGGGDDGSISSCAPAQGDCTGECVDLAVDGRHCGACGHSCLGGTCAQGRCVASTLATGLAAPTAIRIQGTSAYVLRTGGVDRVPLSGGAPVPLFSGAAPFDVTSGPFALAVDANYAYFILRESGTRYVQRCALGGCFASPQLLVAVTVLDPFALDVDATSIAWGGTYQDIRQCPTGSCTASATLVPSQEGKMQIALRPTEVVWANEFNRAVYRCQRVGCVTPTELAGATALPGSPGPIHVYGNDVFFATRAVPGPTYSIYACAVAGCGGAPTLVAQGSGDVGAIVADAAGVYWTVQGSPSMSTGSVLACVGKRQCGTFPTVLASARPSPLGIATTLNAVYWTESRTSGTVGWVAKSID